MLVAGGFIYDHQLGYSASVFTGLGVGWSAILLLEMFGEAVLNFGRREVKVTDMTKLEKAPEDMRDLLRMVDRADEAHRAKQEKGDIT
jgi:hypothetical protein